MSSLPKVFLGLPAPPAQLARRESLAVMESRGQQERRENQVGPAPFPTQSLHAFLSEHRDTRAVFPGAPKTDVDMRDGTGSAWGCSSSLRGGSRRHRCTLGGEKCHLCYLADVRHDKTNKMEKKIPLCSVFPSLGKGPSPPGSGGNRDGLTQPGTLSQAGWERSSWVSSLLPLPILQFFFSFSVKMGFKTPFLLPPPSEPLLYPEPGCCYLFLLF